MTADPAVTAELTRLRTRLPEISASVLATADGMVVAHDAPGLEPDSLAALAAAHLALARRFAHTVDHGELRESVVDCARGYLSSYAAGPQAVLTLVTGAAANLAMVHLEARRCVGRLLPLLTVDGPYAGREIPVQATPAYAAPGSPRSRRTPTATLPAGGRRRGAAG